MADTAFSEDGKYFSTISQDGRLRIWDTETNVLKQEYTPDLHLTAPPSCLQWISVSQSASPQKGRRRKSVTADVETQCIALGTTSGKILIYSVSQGKVETVLQEENTDIHRSSVTSLDWHKRYGLYSVNKDSVVYEWDLQSSTASNKYNVNVDKSKQASSVSAIKIVPHNENTEARYLVTASTQVRVWRLQGSDIELVKCLGHSASPKALLTVASLNNTCWLVEGSQNERLLSFWDITITSDLVPQVNGEETTPNRKKLKKSITQSSPVTVPTPTYNFVLEDAPKQIDVDVQSEENGTKLSLAAVTRSGVVHYYGHMLNGASPKPIKPSVTIQITTADAEPLPLQCCRLPSNGDILLGYNEGTALMFETITLDLKSKTQVLVRGEAKLSKKQKQAKKQNEMNKVREAGVSEATYVEPMGGVSRKRDTPGGTVEVPMEERLQNLTVDVKLRGRAAVNQNLTRLLMQGLHSKDKYLILSVLQNNRMAVALRTCEALPADYVAPLLEELADMATRKTSQCATACTWLSALLQCHSALILATINANTNHHLMHLLAIFTNRRAHLCQLLNLKGRLDLTLTQRQKRHKGVREEPILEYNDTSEEDEMEVVNSAPSESEQSWNESDVEEDNEDAESENEIEKENEKERVDEEEHHTTDSED